METRIVEIAERIKGLREMISPRRRWLRLPALSWRNT